MKRIAWLCWCQTFQVFPTRASKLDIYFFKKWVTLHHDRMDQKLSMPHTWVTKIAAQGHLVKKKKKAVSWDLANPHFFHLKYDSLYPVPHTMQSTSLFLSPKARPNLSFTKDFGGGQKVEKKIERGWSSDFWYGLHIVTDFSAYGYSNGQQY